MKTTSELKKEADDVFSKWVRNRGAVDGCNQCFTCGVTKPIAQLQNGHFVSRGKLATRYDEQNCQVQCADCNEKKKGNKEVFAWNLIKKYGHEIVEELNLRSRALTQMKRRDYIDLIEKYEALLKMR